MEICPFSRESASTKITEQTIAAETLRIAPQLTASTGKAWDGLFSMKMQAWDDSTKKKNGGFLSHGGYPKMDGFC